MSVADRQAKRIRAKAATMIPGRALSQHAHLVVLINRLMRYTNSSSSLPLQPLASASFPSLS